MAQIERLAPDIVLLDIEMPAVDGLEAVRSLPVERQPIFMFVTAFERYAAEAFAVACFVVAAEPRRAAAAGGGEWRVASSGEWRSMDGYVYYVRS